MILLRHLFRTTTGAVAVEFALVGPVVLALVWLIIEYGRLLWWESTVRYAVEEGARCATIGSSPTYCCANTTTYSCGTNNTPAGYAANIAVGLGLSASNFSLTTGSGTNCHGVQVAAQNVTFQFILSSLPPVTLNGTGQLTLNPTACYP